MGKRSSPFSAIALSLMIPVVVSSQPPITKESLSFISVWSLCTRSPPSSMMILQLFSSTCVRCVSYSSGVVPCHACTSMPSEQRAAATSSCVESGLLPVIYISAPPLLSTSQRYAVLASRCTDNAIFLPLKGCSFSKSFLISVRSGQLRLTHSIFLNPDSASPISFISEPFIFSPGIVFTVHNYSLIALYYQPQKC